LLRQNQADSTCPDDADDADDVCAAVVGLELIKHFIGRASLAIRTRSLVTQQHIGQYIKLAN
jgi:hypothetical protein